MDREIWADMYQALFPNAQRPAMYREIERILASEKRGGYCAQIGDQVVGFFEYSIRDYANGCVSQPVPFLEGIWVHPDARGQGHAAALIAFLEDLARQKGYRELGSDVQAWNEPSLNMHTSLGFEETERVVYFRKDL